MSQVYVLSIIVYFLNLILAEFGKLELRVVLKNPTYAPLAGEEEKILASEVGNTLSVVRKLQSLGIKSLVLDPADLRLAKVGATKIASILTLESVLKNLELKNADNADDNSFKT